MPRNDSISSAPTNGGDGALFYYLLGSELPVADQDFLSRKVQHHLDTWKSVSGSALCKTLLMGNDLVLVTDSPQLAEEWVAVERNYIEYVLGGGIPGDDDFEDLFFSPGE